MQIFLYELLMSSVVSLSVPRLSHNHPLPLFSVFEVVFLVQMVFVANCSVWLFFSVRILSNVFGFPQKGRGRSDEGVRCCIVV